MAAIFVQTFQKELIFADYFLDTESYAALCENKEAPELKCEGKCQMAKKMEDTDQKDKQAPDRTKSVDITLFVQQFTEVETEQPAPHEKKFAHFSLTETAGISGSVFRPPARSLVG